MTTPGLINKRAHVEEQIEALRANARIVARVGGVTASNMEGEVAFQQERLDLIDWLIAADEAAVRARLALECAPFGDGAVGLLTTGNVTGLTPELVQRVSRAELCQIALGEFASLRDRVVQLVPDDGGGA